MAEDDACLATALAQCHAETALQLGNERKEADHRLSGCAADCYGQTCDNWSSTCHELETTYGCSCTGCTCDLKQSEDQVLSRGAPQLLDARRLDDCVSTDNGAADPYGDGCDMYVENPSWCGAYDDTDFTSNEMCCACGGGASCESTCYGHSCEYWTGLSYTCSTMENVYSCDCTDCDCPTPAPTYSTKPTPAPSPPPSLAPSTLVCTWAPTYSIENCEFRGGTCYATKAGCIAADLGLVANSFTEEGCGENGCGCCEPSDSERPTTSPTISPSPTPVPSPAPTQAPTIGPTPLPSYAPSPVPSILPSPAPTQLPSLMPTPFPTYPPSPMPTIIPTAVPSAVPSQIPSPPPTQLPSAMPTPTPSMTPTAMPSSIPSMAPTPLPTPGPTPLPDLTIVPAALELSITKPDTAEATAYFVNLNREQLQYSISVATTTLPNGTAWSASPISGTLSDGENDHVVLKCSSVGLAPQLYTLKLAVLTQTARSLPVHKYLPISLTIATRASPNKTEIICIGNPTLGSNWDTCRIVPRDSDDFAIASLITADLFTFELSKVISFDDDTENLISRTACQVAWLQSDPGPCYSVACIVPPGDAAGNWTYTVALNGDVIAESPIRMRCPAEECALKVQLQPGLDLTAPIAFVPQMRTSTDTANPAARLSMVLFARRVVASCESLS